MNRKLLSQIAVFSLLVPFATPAPGDEVQRELTSLLRRRHVPAKQVDGKLVAVDLEKRRDVSRWVPELAKVKSLEEIRLGHSSVSDDDVESLATLPNLATLDAPRTALTDKAAEALSKCPSLRRLNLAGTNVSLEGVAALTELAGLESLSVAGTRIPDRALSGVDNWENLQELDLSFTEAGDDLLASLAELENLQRLNLSRCACTSAGMRYVGRLQQLRELHLDGTGVRDVGLEHLMQLEHLETVTARNSLVSKWAMELHGYYISPATLWGKEAEKTMVAQFDGWYLLETLGWLEKRGNKEVLMFSPTRAEVDQALLRKTHEIHHVLNAPTFCVLFEDPLKTLHERQYFIRVPSLWMTPPTSLGRRLLGKGGAMTWWPQTYSEGWTEINYRYVTESMDAPYKHAIRIKIDGTHVVIDGNRFDLRYGKKYIVVDNQGNAREVGIP